MPGPPTPVSVCPLIYLEIRDGASARAYSSSRPHDVFTLTIEGERPVDAKMGTLIILIHRGVQQVVCTSSDEVPWDANKSGFSSPQRNESSVAAP